MSRFDDELTKTAENAWQNSGAPAPTQPGGYAENQFEVPFAESFPLTSAPTDDTAAWTAEQPIRRQLDVTDTVTPDIMGQSGSSAVFASKYDIDENLYSVYKASREIRDAIEAGADFDFVNLVRAASNCYSNVHSASNDHQVVHTVGTIAGIVNEIENELVSTSNYKQAYSNLVEFESLLDGINKLAAGDADADAEDDGDADDNTMEASRQARINAREERLATKWCTGPGCEIANCKGEMEPKEATNGNQETLQHDDVRALDNVGPYMQSLQAEAVVDVTAPQVVNGEDAGYVNYYNDGAETGKVPQQGDDTNPWPYDGTNPALAPYAGTVAAVQASREKLFDALNVVERLEKLGMVEDADRIKHLAKFEQMSDSQLSGFKESLDMLEKSGARQPRSQKVASGNNRMPEMGRLTTASTVTRGSIQADDWLMTL